MRIRIFKNLQNVFYFKFGLSNFPRIQDLKNENESSAHYSNTMGDLCSWKNCPA